MNSDVYSIIVETDGRILIGGSFTSLQSTGAGSAVTWSYLARLSSTGVLDSTFAPTPNNFNFYLRNHTFDTLVFIGPGLS